MNINMNRRRAMGFLGCGAVAAASLIYAPSVYADTASMNASIAKLFGDRAIKDGGIEIDMQEIAENGNMVPFAVSVESPMTEDNYVKSIHMFAEGNPNPNMAVFHFTPASGVAKAKSRMRLAKTQKIVAIAEMSDGTLVRGSREIKVTIGGCGG